ncbi:glycosyltransferase family 2 protein [Chryseobacterium gotjawalense]|uniref:Glycosyltransferase family 2 protein n=1 Tax=Chryseobacterium gotjawalense TaxID=3042315 RepID=A0ABY8RDW1_9FLAO|nr:glycosyltransferase family 2 protein [Chryseobacterium sp. wdc7]WHF51232.1 glycosyltransferase family 2 protein [Chryseobacterium sp. wdc7]
MMLTERISGLIITFNEEKNIQEILDCFTFCDEIIVVDSFSTDKTVEIASRNPKVKIIQHQFEDFTKQRNIALDAAKNDWVIFLDGDERITPELQKEIISELNKSDKKDAYYFYRKFYFGGKPVSFSGTQTDKNIRLFRRTKCRYTADKKVHETLEVQGTTGILKNKLIHYSFENFEQFKKKMLYYGLLKGSELTDKGKKYSIITHWGKVALKFMKTYFLKLGFLDGITGLKISYLQSLYVSETYRTLKNNN